MKMHHAMRAGVVGVAASVLLAVTGAASAGVPDGVQIYGDVDLLGFGYGDGDPFAGATLVGLAPNAITAANNAFAHSFPFDPEVGEYPGTDQIYVGSFEYAGGDGYSQHPNRIAGIQTVTIDYSALVPQGQVLTSLTLGIAFDDFQNPLFGNPYTVVINDGVNSALTGLANSIDQTTPLTRLYTIGLDLSTLREDHTLTLQIRQAGGSRGGDLPQGDGWAIDFLTIGATTVPTPGAATLAALAGLVGLRRRR